MMDGVKKEDSVIRANSVINNWAIEKILTERAELNLNETKLQKISSLVKEYKSSLLSEAYLEALINSTINLEIDSVEIQSFYEKNMVLFKLNEDIFKLAFIELPLDFSDTYQIRSKIRRFKSEDKFYLDSISYRFKNSSLSNGKWITEKEFRKEFSFTNPPYILDELIAGKYQLKYIIDLNEDSNWTTGSWEKKIQAEKVYNYSSEITIRSNWDLELEWLILD